MGVVIRISLIVFMLLICAIALFSGNLQKGEGTQLVKQTQLSNSKNIEISDADFYNLTMLVLAEAASQPTDGKIAVAATVLNRYKENNYGSISDVIFAPNQFSCCYNGYFCHADGIPLSYANYSEESVQNAKNAVKAALAGEDPTRVALGGGALYYYNPDYTPDYELAMRANLQKTLRIGDHVFYRDWPKV